MNNFYFNLLLITALVFHSNMGFCQSKEIKIKFIGNCGLYMTDGKSNIYIDFPYISGAFNYMEYDRAELDSIKENATFIFTHEHPDHYAKELLNKIKGNKYGPWNIAEISKIKDAIQYFDIIAFKTNHIVFGISFDHYSYCINWHNKRIYISGDTENADILAKVKNIDWLFAPAWILDDADEKNIKIDAQKIAIYHIGKMDKIANTDSKFKLLDKSGEIIMLPYE